MANGIKKIEDEEVDQDDEDFYDAQSAASQIKTRIVTKYFGAWSTVMIANIKRFGGDKLAYVDLYCGRGKYRTGEPSTPVLILKQAVAHTELQKRLVTMFNDKDKDHIAALEENIAAIEDIDKLAHEPTISCSEVGEDFEKYFGGLSLVPTFTFVDPFGYKGVSLKLLTAMLKDFGCDLVLFFSYNRINAALTNPIVEDHIIGLFGGKERVDDLRNRLTGKKPAQRELLILECFSEALGEMGFKFVLPFSFMQAKRKRTSHYLIFVCKHQRGYTIMKDIMARESSENDQGVPSFGYVPAISEEETPLLFELSRPIEDLGQLLLDTYAGSTMTTLQIFNDHNVGRRFVLKNYKDALCKLLEHGKVSTDRKPARRGSFADDLKVTFPTRNA